MAEINSSAVLTDNLLYTSLERRGAVRCLRWKLTDGSLECHGEQLVDNDNPSSPIVSFTPHELIWRRCGMWGMEFAVRGESPIWSDAQDTSQQSQDEVNSSLDRFWLHADKVEVAQQWWRLLDNHTDFSRGTSCSSLDTIDKATDDEVNNDSTLVTGVMAAQRQRRTNLLNMLHPQPWNLRDSLELLQSRSNPLPSTIITSTSLSPNLLQALDMETESTLPTAQTLSTKDSSITSNDDQDETLDLIGQDKHLTATLNLLEIMQNTSLQLAEMINKIGDTEISTFFNQLDQHTNMATKTLIKVIKERHITLQSATVQFNIPSIIVEDENELSVTLVGTHPNIIKLSEMSRASNGVSPEIIM